MADNLTAQANPFDPAPRERSLDDMVPQDAEGSIAHRFSTQEADRMRYTARWGQWHRWNGALWESDDTLEVFTRVREFCRMESAASTNGVAKKIYSASTVAAVERLSRYDRRHVATIHQWDSDPMLLNTPGGVVDLRTGQLRRARPDDYCTRTTTVAPTPGGSYLRWMEFLEQVTDGDTELMMFLQRVAGYCLTGNTQEECLFFLYGTGGNGKGTFVHTLQTILGKYARSAPIDLLIETYGEHHPTELAGLHGARLVTMAETEEGKRWNESKLKSLTGNDRITARFMRQDFFDYTPQFKIVISGNHRPALKSVDEAMKRRLILIPFTVTITKRDLKLKEKLQQQAGGILQWAIEGCLEWQRQGLNIPTKVREASRDYMEAEDSLGSFISEDCNPYGEEPSKRLWEAWERRAKDRNEYVGTQKTFSMKLQDRGFKTRKSHGIVMFEGISLK